QTVTHQVARVDLTTPLDVGWSSFEPYDVRLLQLKLRRVFDRHDTLIARYETGENVEQRRLAGARTARDQDVESRSHHAAQYIRRRLGHSADLQEVVHRQQLDGKTTDRKHGTIQGQRWNDGVHA